MIKKVLLLGSGGLRIGQAGEFDYSGSQAIKALKQEHIKVVLVNPNIATIQTDPGLADVLYLQPLNLTTVTKIIEKEKPDGILLGFGGQTALNLGLELEEAGVLKKYGVKVLGTPIKTIKMTEDRDLFKAELKKINVKTPQSFAVNTVKDALLAAKKIDYPIMLRSGYSLGGLGSGKITNAEELAECAAAALHGAPQILIEEYLGGWKEIEYEVVRDQNDTAITVCNMENFDPMGVHTGESIVVAPSQTLNNKEYHELRQIAIKVARGVGIVGECNIQYALNPANGDYRVIEMNARLSRSSALASKATGYPLAFVAAKLALGKNLRELKNAVTQKTSACFEPALDYLVVKIPRWDLTKFKSADRRIGSEMKSMGEVMAIGRSFPEALQKAVRMLNIGASGLSDYPFKITDLEDEIEHPTDRRLFAVYQALLRGASVKKINELSKIDSWFLEHLKQIAGLEKQLVKNNLDENLLRLAKKFGFGDKQIGKLKKLPEDKVRESRLKYKIKPVIKQIDTLAGEFSAETNYLYTTYHGTVNDVEPTLSPLSKGGDRGICLTAGCRERGTISKAQKSKRPIIILGSGPYCIGSSVEFDWCAVNTAKSLRELKESPIIINSNPETVSTDYDESDRLYFEELTLERVRDIADFEQPKGLIVSVGGQIPNNLAIPLAGRGYKLLGTTADSIDMAENRQRFSALLQKLNIDQPEWEEVKSLEQALKFAERVQYPVLVRPSYVLSGTAMNVVKSADELTEFLSQAALVSPEHPVVISQFISNAKELDIDGVAQNGRVQIYAIGEHIENAGVHSGDATIVLPPQRLYLETIRQAKRIAKKIARALNITGPFNIQFIAKNNELKVIECNLRASRSFPFVSKITNYNFITVATKILLNKFTPEKFHTLDLPYVGVKSPQFSYQRLKGADPIAGVEMASTGEVAALGLNYQEAFYTSWLATEQQIKGKSLLLTVSDEQKPKLTEFIKLLDEAGFNIYATEGTHDALAKIGVATAFVYKAHEQCEPSVLGIISRREVDLIINIPSLTSQKVFTDGYLIRRAAVNHHLPIITNLQSAELFIKCLLNKKINWPVLSWQEFVAMKEK